MHFDMQIEFSILFLKKRSKRIYKYNTLCAHARAREAKQMPIMMFHV